MLYAESTDFMGLIFYIERSVALELSGFQMTK